MPLVYSLQDTTNYRDHFDRNTTEIFTRYTGLILEYLTRCSEIIKTQKLEYYKYIIYRGIKTIAHVFKILLLYTKNLDLASHHTQKAYYYYVEFIGQIDDDNHTYLQLNSNDASLFVYKKTIFDINNEFRKEFASIIGNELIIENVDLLILSYNNLLEDNIHNLNIQPGTPINIIRIVTPALKKLVQHVLNLSLVGTEQNYNEKLKVLYFLTNSIKTDISKKISVIECFAKKLRQRYPQISHLQRQLMHHDNDANYVTLTPLRYVNWLLSADISK